MTRTLIRSTAVLLAALALAAAACGEEGTPEDEGATPTQEIEGVFQLPDTEPISAELAQQLRSLAPLEDEVDEALPDLAPFERQLAAALGQEYEGVDLFTPGLVAGYTAFYRPADWPANENQFAYVSFVLFGDAGGAGGVFAQMTEGFAGGPGAFEVARGDEAGGIVLPASQDQPGGTIIVLRQGRVVAFLVVFQTDDKDRREGMRQLAGVVAGRIEAALPV
jgi:hypothetical protein